MEDFLSTGAASKLRALGAIYEVKNFTALLETTAQEVPNTAALGQHPLVSTPRQVPAPAAQCLSCPSPHPL